MVLRVPPAFVKDALYGEFSFGQKEVSCQVATSLNNNVHLRTMRFYEISPDGSLVFCIFTNSQKWRELQQNPSCSACLYSEAIGQIVVEGNELLACNSKHENIARQYWQRLSIMWQNAYRAKISGTKLPELFGVILLEPFRWEVLRINHDNYFSSKRLEAVWLDDTWNLGNIKRDLSLGSSTPPLETGQPGGKCEENWGMES